LDWRRSGGSQSGQRISLIPGGQGEIRSPEKTGERGKGRPYSRIARKRTHNYQTIPSIDKWGQPGFVWQVKTLPPVGLGKANGSPVEWPIMATTINNYGRLSIAEGSRERQNCSFSHT